jgi:superfamily II DNA or RNA helicase
MIKLEDLRKDAIVTGVVHGRSVKIVSLEKVGNDSATIYYRDDEGKLGERMLFRSDEDSLSIVEVGKPWSFDADQKDFKLAAEAYRIHLAHLFDPLMAVHSSSIEPLPHQITAVYEAMLPKQPLRYLLADDPGAGKTIMAGLLLRELMVRGDVKRCLIIPPGGLVEQWQDEMGDKFGMDFEIFNREMVESSRSGNPFSEKHQLIARLDQLSRAEDLKEKLEHAEDWDIVVVDEAHKMSASWYGTKFDPTKRYQLGELLGRKSRHFLLMTATPHNGKDEDFQAFMALLDSDRFYGKARDGERKVDFSDLMRRMIKEDLVKFDGTPLFPERKAYTVNYELSPIEADLYNSVTEYVREEMNRADRLDDSKRKGNIGFALTILQRRLASSPEAIYQSLIRRCEKLRFKLEEAKVSKKGLSYLGSIDTYNGEVDDEDSFTSEEREELENEIAEKVTAAQTIPELEAEIKFLEKLIIKAKEVRFSGEDRKWQELSSLLQDSPEMKESSGARRKLILFTEHRDTLNYLFDRISNLLGRRDCIEIIHGGIKREERRKSQERFTQDKEVTLLLATDAAGEGINLQRANLMINYDLPWNPNRLEQRFGRIHRIGQTEVCHLWNLVAKETREGEVYFRLLKKIEKESESLRGKVFDVLGEAFEELSLKDLLLEAIRYGDRPEVKARLYQKIDNALDREHLTEIIKRNALTADHMDTSKLFDIKADMEKAEALKLQPFFIRAFFEEAFSRLKGDLRKRETGRFEIRHVPTLIRGRDRVIGGGNPVIQRYERICFEKSKTRIEGKLPAQLIAPGHPLMDSVIDLTLENLRNMLKRGTVFIDRADEGVEPHLLFIIEHTVRDGKTDSRGEQRVISRRMQFVLFDRNSEISQGGYAPYLDYDSPTQEDANIVKDIIEEGWLAKDLDSLAVSYAASNLVPDHFTEVKKRREHLVNATLQAVHERLTKEINYWSHRYIHLKMEVEAGRQPRIQPENAKRRAEELTTRLESRTKDLEAQRHIVSSTPVVVGGALVIPQGLINKRQGKEVPMWCKDAEERKRIELCGMKAVMDKERELGFSPEDVSHCKYGWDVQSRTEQGDVRFIEVKGRAKGADTVTITKNEILACLNQPERYILAIVLIDGEQTEGPHYIKNPFDQEPDFGVTSINYDIESLLKREE